jgi:MFS family permease
MVSAYIIAVACSLLLDHSCLYVKLPLSLTPSFNRIINRGLLRALQPQRSLTRVELTTWDTHQPLRLALSFYLNSLMKSHLIIIVVAVYIAGKALGAITQVAVGDRLGRSRFMQIMCIIVTIGTIIQTASVNCGMYLGGRLIAG